MSVYNKREKIKRNEVIPLQINKNILSQYSDLQQEEKNLVRRIQSLNAQLSNMEVKGYMVADSVSCGKRGKKPLGSRKIQGFPYPEYGRKKEQLKTYKMQLELADEKLLQMLTQVEEYIESIEDSRIRRIMRHRYIDNLNWTQVAINMGKNHTEESCRKAHDRFLQNL